MAGDADFDTLMMMVSGGQPISAESTATIDTVANDILMKDFKPKKFFEIEDFDLGIDLNDTDSTATQTTNQQNQQGNQRGNNKSSSARFSKWVQGLAVTAGHGANSQLYPVQMEPFGFTKQMDCSSPVLFQNCFQTKPFDSVVVVKRKRGIVQGLTRDTSYVHVPYLRLEFTGVLLISADWDGSDQMKEKYKFVSQTLVVQYRQQNLDGSRGTVFGGTELNLKKTT
jgi:type VI protein secretion system component Hcp